MNKTKKSRLCAAALTVFLCITVSRCVPGRKRAFVTQPGGGNRQCGAFSTAYYQWLKAGKTLSADPREDKAAVDAIYNEIQFGGGFAGALEPYNIPLDYSDPLKIMKYLGSGAAGSADAGIMCRRPGDPLFDSLYALLGRMEA
ncbi:MAG: hypothetical protein LBK64_01045, partial [Spirochaetaceae bacterium]|nr:hypothetical protein [Spirochaetaceae bacterium]